MAIIASRSKLLREKFLERLSERKESDRQTKIVVDFGEQVHYQAFRKIVDFCYLGNTAVINGINDSTEMIELIKLASALGLSQLLKAAET